MSWYTSNRRNSLPSNWEAIRAKVLREASYRCAIEYGGCTGVATEVDHINPGNDHTRCQAACKPCHSKKSSAEGVSRRRELNKLKKRPAERHPGRR